MPIFQPVGIQQSQTVVGTFVPLSTCPVNVLLRTVGNPHNDTIPTIYTVYIMVMGRYLLFKINTISIFFDANNVAVIFLFLVCIHNVHFPSTFEILTRLSCLFHEPVPSVLIPSVSSMLAHIIAHQLSVYPLQLTVYYLNRMTHRSHVCSGVDIQGEQGVYTPPVRKLCNFLCT